MYLTLRWLHCNTFFFCILLTSRDVGKSVSMPTWFKRVTHVSIKVSVNLNVLPHADHL